MAENTFERIQQKQLKYGKIILITVLLFEILTFIPNLYTTEFWFSFAVKQGIFSFIAEKMLIIYVLIQTLSYLLPVASLVFSIFAFKGYEFGRNLTAAVYGLYAFRMFLYLPYIVTILSQPAINVYLIFAVFFIAFAFYITMGILMWYRGVNEYMYTKRYK